MNGDYYVRNDNGSARRRLNPQSSIRSLLPPLERCDDLKVDETCTLIQAAGFEDRALAAGKILKSSNGRCVILDYRPFNPKNRLSEVKERLRHVGLVIEADDVVLYDRFDPNDFEQRLRSRLIAHRTETVLVDVSAMSKLAILLVLIVCRDLDRDIRIFYAEAADYAPSRTEFESAKAQGEIHQPSLQVFTGVHGVVRVASLASVAMQGHPTAAVVFMSFNDALTQVLLNTVFPSRLFLLNGQPPLHSWREEATAWIHDQVRREWAEDNPVQVVNGVSTPLPACTSSTLDYRETVQLLLDFYWELSPNHRFLLAPSGSKMQTLGCFLTKALHSDIHIEYPSPEGFLPEYSTGIGNRWSVHLGYVSRMLQRVAEAEVDEYLAILA